MAFSWLLPVQPRIVYKLPNCMEDLSVLMKNMGFSPEESARIAGVFRKKDFEKGEFFVREGKQCLQLGFVARGMFQFFSTTSSGEERTTYISVPHTFVASLLTFLTEAPARESIRAIAHSTLWVIDKKEVVALQNQIPAFKDFYIRLLEEQICCIDKAKFDLITLTAEQRYENLCRQESALLQQVPLQYIASMLGITPRHLSRLRAKI